VQIRIKRTAVSGKGRCLKRAGGRAGAARLLVPPPPVREGIGPATPAGIELAGPGRNRLPRYDDASLLPRRLLLGRLRFPAVWLGPRSLRRAHAMPAILDERSCTACGQFHVLCSSDTVLPERDGLYEYICPSRRKRVRIAISQWSRFDLTCPPEAVPLRRLGR
jgi:hypothetical protein